jgi:hypothetical protein
VIVPLTLKLIVSVPVPARQSPIVVSDLALALLIASRKVQNPLPDGLARSVALLTVIVLSLACSRGWVRTRQTGANTISNATRSAGRAKPADGRMLEAIARSHREVTSSRHSNHKFVLVMGYSNGLC